MLVVLDSNIFVADLLMEGNAFRLVYASRERTGVRFATPQVVFDEVANKVVEMIRDLAVKAGSLNRDARRLLGRDLSATLTEEDLKRDAAAHARRIREAVSQPGDRVLPYPVVTHAELCARDLSRRKPFKVDGTGYRDALIWHSILELARTTNERIVVVTRNTRDFGGGTFHDDLIEDLLAAGMERTRIELLNSLEDFVQGVALPTLKRQDELIELLTADEMDGFSLRDWVRTSLLEVIRDSDLEDMFGPFEQGHASVRVRSLSEIRDISVDDVRAVPQEGLLVSASMSGTFLTEWSAHETDTERYEDVRACFGRLSEGESAWIEDQPCRAVIRFSLILDGTSFDVISAEIDEVDGAFGALELNPHPVRPDDS